MIIIEVAGHLGRDPETRFTPSGQKLTTFSIACNLKRSGKEETIWWRIVIWGDRFDKLLPYLKKGSAVIVIGEFSQAPQVYVDKNGVQQVSLELTADIIRLSPFGRPDRAEGTQQGAMGHSPAAGSNYGEPSGYGSQPTQSYGGNPQAQQPYAAPQAQPYGGSSNYGSYSGPAMDPMPEEDKLPF